MSRVNANGYFDSATPEQRYELREKLAAQRTADARNGYYTLGGGVVDPLPADAPQFVVDYYDYYKTPRGNHKRSLNSNGGFNATSPLPFMNMPLLTYANEIRNAVMLIHGEKAHSLYFSNDTYKKLTENWVPGTPNNKVLLIVPGANHTDLYDKMDIIPFDAIEVFFNEYLK
ncbi:MAG: alpha/beta hydrolase [Paramuribaculum sp.]|nr:alpha/beta hydrolase [Paramuribaculum sp.]